MSGNGRLGRLERFLDPKVNAWGWLRAGIAAARLDVDQLARFSEAARRSYGPEEALEGLRATEERLVPDIELATSLLGSFRFILDAGARPDRMSIPEAVIKTREQLETRLLDRTKRLKSRLAELANQGRRRELDCWMRFVGAVTEYLVEVVSALRPELLSGQRTGGIDEGPE